MSVDNDMPAAYRRPKIWKSGTEWGKRRESSSCGGGEIWGGQGFWESIL